MCGIAGAVDHRVSRADLVNAMTDELGHRGPDDRGVWDGGPVVLGHTRLAVLDLTSAGHQPMADPDTGNVLTFNGEIYNWRDLRKRLESQGATFESMTDTEVILKLYRRYGIDGLEMMEGMFAFALWDRTSEVLHLVRDRYGVKPLLYGEIDGALYFASEMRCFRHTGSLGSLDMEALGLYAATNYIPAPHTIWEKVRRLSPGCRMEVRPGSASPEAVRWFDPVAAVEAHTGGPASDEVIEATLREGVEARLEADVPVGVFLSGGIDSGLVAAFASNAHPSVKTVSMSVPDVSTLDESVRSRLTARHLGTDHEEVTVSHGECVSAVGRVLDRLDEPFADSSLIPSFLVSEVARRSVTVALSGDGGDELFGGYDKHLSARWVGVPLAPEILRPVAKLLSYLPDSKAGGLAGTVRKGKRLTMGVSGSMPERHRNLIGHVDPQLSAAFERIDGGALQRRVETELDRTAGWDDDILRMLMADVTFMLPFDMLEKVDRASMWNSLEVRSPFLHSALLPLAFSRPGTDHVGYRTTKRVLRRIADRHLPQQVVEGPKRGFGVPIGSWLRGPLRSEMEERLSPSEIRRHGLLRVGDVERMRRVHQSGRRDLSWELWNMMVLQSWADSNL